MWTPCERPNWSPKNCLTLWIVQSVILICWTMFPKTTHAYSTKYLQTNISWLVVGWKGAVCIGLLMMILNLKTYNVGSSNDPFRNAGLLRKGVYMLLSFCIKTTLNTRSRVPELLRSLANLLEPFLLFRLGSNSLDPKNCTMVPHWFAGQPGLGISWSRHIWNHFRTKW